MRPPMLKSNEPTRPLAKRRLEEAITRALNLPDPQAAANCADLRRILALISQEKRFLLFMFLMHREELLTDYEIADAIRDQRSNVVRNIHAFISEGLLMVRRDPTTGIVRFRVNREIAGRLSQLFAC